MQGNHSEISGENVRLWGLVHSSANCISGEDMHKTFYIRLNGHGGVLAFASALDSEIYCQQLNIVGMSGWSRQRLERIDLERAMASLPAQERKLMLALGFSASDTNDLLLDQNRTLITPLLPIPYAMRHSLHGISHLQIHAEVFSFLERWWEQVGGVNYLDEVRMAAAWSDQALARCAGEALAKGPMIDMQQYYALWNDTGVGDECAVFSPEAGAWRFSTLRGRRSRALH